VSITWGEHPVETCDEVTLSNRATLRIRPLLPGEADPLRELYARLSPRSRYLRFFSAAPEAPESMVRLLACADGRRRLALVAEHEGRHGWETVGLANFAAVDDSSVEVALVVRDDWQNRGVGAQLGRRLLRAAEVRGYHQFVVHLLPDNLAIRILLKKLCKVVSTRVSGGVSEVTFVRRPSGPSPHAGRTGVWSDSEPVLTQAARVAGDG
jgi:GNAT superfamily N-acetyltransferase